MAKEYIEREALRKKIFPYEGIDKAKYAINAKAVEAAINGTPAADVVEVAGARIVSTSPREWRSVFVSGSRIDRLFPPHTITIAVTEKGRNRDER